MRVFVVTPFLWSTAEVRDLQRRYTAAACDDARQRGEAPIAAASFSVPGEPAGTVIARNLPWALAAERVVVYTDYTDIGREDECNAWLDAIEAASGVQLGVFGEPPIHSPLVVEARDLPGWSPIVCGVRLDESTRLIGSTRLSTDRPDRWCARHSGHLPLVHSEVLGC